ncbi:CHASE2 domain-containing serine/threonine-protein kinase [Stagnimonas aquatica]|uniref:CHASE2 domain-containing serine/threonine-protein kinase n=1 Tax=Stagnimonas aquatica TaxID=2689987 RepID=UPI001F44903F|nr:serine/threonine-protein kinase [Stagnimonas aquatica]
MKERLWTKDWFAALAFSLLFAVLAYGVFGSGFQGLERAAYDLGVRGHERQPSDRIAIVAIDDDSIAKLGRWPWPRVRQAELLDRINAGQPKLVVNTVLYLEPEQGAAGDVQGLADYLATSPLQGQIPAEIETFGIMLHDAAGHSPEIAQIAKAYQDSALTKTYVDAINELMARIKALGGGASPDATLGSSLAASHGVLPMLFHLGRPQGLPDKPLPDYVQREALTSIVDRVDARASGQLPVPTIAVVPPIATLAAAAAGLGHLNITVDEDGAVRRTPLVLQYYDSFFPSLSLRTASLALNLKPSDIEVRLGEGVQLGGLNLGTNPQLMLYSQFYADKDGAPAFRTDSAYDVYAGKIPADKYKDKIVLLGTTAAATGDSFATPVSPSTAPVTLLAHEISSILQQDYFTRPGWARIAEFLLFLSLAAYLALAVPRLSAGLAAGITIGLALALFATEYFLMTGPALWLKLTVPSLFVLTGYGFMLLKRFNLTEKLKFASETESAESNKMLGLAFQGQGQLDMAFDKFKRVKPVDDKLLDLIYNLALDFERKRQFNKAEAVYQYIAGNNKDFKDVQAKLNRAKKLSETIILGGAMGATTADGTMIMAGGGTEKPMLGRYQVEKELGKGAMGVVYLGKDPKIGRMVAIKTMALSQEFEADELDDVKARFFREAETAGRLSHPNIVSIFDAGEEHDLAYIAMEFVKGHDLTKHTKPNLLLPVPEVLRIMADAADALDYAHSNSVVHRDIKPANMMLLDGSQVIKLMDFGIARIADSSKTKTGMVLGTPSYMSPEQLAGKKVDGRSDIFSLGVTTYQLLTGSLPFLADSMATLMYKIANETHASPLVVRPDLPPEIVAVIDKALAKNFEQRYQRGSEFARELRELLRKLGS